MGGMTRNMLMSREAVFFPALECHFAVQLGNPVSYVPRQQSP